MHLCRRTSKLAKYQTFLASFAQHLDAKTMKQSRRSKRFPQNPRTRFPPMGKTAQSYADGQHSENRKRLFLEALGKGIDRIIEGDRRVFPQNQLEYRLRTRKRSFSTMLV